MVSGLMGSEGCTRSPMYPRCIGDASANHWRRRGEIGLHFEPHCRCIGDAARCSDPVYFEPIWDAYIRCPDKSLVRC
eukprot:1895032-Pyramimonas_sp.AAC.1